MDAGDAQRVERQVAVYQDRLHEALEECSNFAGMRTQDRQLILYGVGEPTPPIAALMGEAPLALDVVWERVPYTADELDLETRRIMERFPQLNGGGPAHGFTGLEFTTADEALLSVPDPQAALETRYPAAIRYCEAPRFA